jgi:hypothetical protein
VRAASSLGRRTGDASQNLLQFCMGQPLVLAGIGLAVGAALGASLPGTEAENQLMGESSDQVKERAREFAEDQYAKGKAARENVIEAAQSALHEEAAHAEARLFPQAEQDNIGRPHPRE